MLTLFNASAGSGKTYTLILEYLSLVLQRPTAARGILVITFTNDATNELKRRMIERLYELAHPERINDEKTLAGVADLRNQLLERNKNLTAEKIQQNAQTALTYALHRSDTLSIQTIDSFFQRILRSFGRELSLSFGYAVEMDSRGPLKEAVINLLERLGKPGEEALTKWMLEYQSEILREKNRSNMRGRLFKEGKLMFADRPYNSKLQTSKEKNYSAAEELRGVIQKLSRAFEAECAAIGTEFMQQLEEYGLEITEFKGAGRSPFRFFQKFTNRIDLIDELKKYKPGVRQVLGILLDLSEDIEIWAGKDKKKQSKMQPLMENEGIRLLRKLKHHFSQHYARYLTAQMLSKKVYLLGLMHELENELQKYLERTGKIMIGSVPQLLLEVVNENEPHFIYEKTGNRYGHFLIDEFQDTSQEQWRVMKPLLHNSVAENLSSFIVGDPKQSIYFWRGGDVSLFLNTVEADLGMYMNPKQTLGKNYRSLPRIVEFNNSVFCSLPEVLNGVVKEQEWEEDALLAEQLCKIYEPDEVSQQPTRGASGGPKGFVRLSFLPHPLSDKEKAERAKESTEDGEDDDLTGTWKQQAIEQMIGQIRICIQQDGYRAGDVAVLIRDSKTAKIVSEALTKQLADLNVKVDSGSLLSVQTAPVVRILHAMLRFISRPDDKLNLVRAAHDYQTYIRKANFDWAAYLPNITPLGERKADDPKPQSQEVRLITVFPEAFQEYYQVLGRLDLYELTEELIQHLDLAPHMDAFGMAFMEQVFKYTSVHGASTLSFLDWWEEEGRFESIARSSGSNAIRVLTVHKSKGLEFPIVFIPDVDWELQPATSHLKVNDKWVPTEGTVWAEYSDYLPLPMTKSLLDTEFDTHWTLFRRNTLIEHVNLLYVALTRASERLYIYGPQAQLKPDGKSEDSKYNKGAAILLRNLFSPAYPRPVIGHGIVETVVNYSEDLHTFCYGEASPNARPAETLPPNNFPFAYHSHPWRKRMVFRPKANNWVEFSSQTFQLERLNWGLLVHSVLSGIQYAADAEEKLQKQLERRQMSGELSTEDRPLLELQVRGLLEHPQFKLWLHEDWKVRNEQTILDPSGKLLKPDRVLTHTDGRAVVIEFKTGNPEEAHPRQVREYMKHLIDMGHSPVEGWLVYLGKETNFEAV